MKRGVGTASLPAEAQEAKQLAFFSCTIMFLFLVEALENFLCFQCFATEWGFPVEHKCSWDVQLLQWHPLNHELSHIIEVSGPVPGDSLEEDQSERDVGNGEVDWSHAWFSKSAWYLINLALLWSCLHLQGHKSSVLRQEEGWGKEFSACKTAWVSRASWHALISSTTVGFRAALAMSACAGMHICLQTQPFSKCDLGMWSQWLAIRVGLSWRGTSRPRSLKMVYISGRN